MQNKILSGIIILVLAFGIGYYFGKTNTGLKKEEKIKIGMVSITTGPLAAYGEIAKNAIDIAVDEINNSGGISGKPVEIIFEDYAFDSKRAIPALESLAQRGIKFFLIDGSPAAATLAPVIRDKKYFSIVSSATVPSYSDGSNLTCRLALTSKVFGPAMLQFMSKKFPNPRLATLVINNEYGKGLEGKVLEGLKGFNGQLIIQEGFDQASGDFRTQITKIKGQEKNIDILLIINAANTIEPMLKQLRELGFNKPIITDTFTAQNPELKDKNLAEGFFFADYKYFAQPQDTDSSLTANFKKNYFDKYGKYPPPHAANSFDELKILAKALTAVGEDTVAVADYITKEMVNYEGVGGNFKFNDDCEVERDMVFRVMKNSQPQLVQ